MPRSSPFGRGRVPRYNQVELDACGATAWCSGRRRAVLSRLRAAAAGDVGLRLIPVSRSALWWGLAACSLGGCTGISVEPSCPNELAVGESGAVRANETNPGAIPTYLWEVFPSSAGEFTAPDAPVTTFQAKEPGDVTIRLTAADGLYQVVSECHATVTEAEGVAVSLSVDRGSPVVGESVMLVCRSTGETVAEARTITQADGTVVELDLLSEGVVTFTPEEPGEVTFTCVGESRGGQESEPDTLIVTVVSPSDDTDNTNDNDNTSDNDNTNDNDNANDNDNGGRPPIRPGRP